MTTTYRSMTGEQARAAGAAPDLIDYPLTLDADRDAYEPDRRGVFRLADGRPVELLGTDGGEPEDQTLGRDWSWVAGALSDAHTRGVNIGLNQVNDGHIDTLNAITAEAPEAWDGEEAIDDIAVRYVAHLVAEVRRLGGHLHPLDPETGEPWAEPAGADPAVQYVLEELASALSEQNDNGEPGSDDAPFGPYASTARDGDTLTVGPDKRLEGWSRDLHGEPVPDFDGEVPTSPVVRVTVERIG
jgi:hypothetical protein